MSDQRYLICVRHEVGNPGREEVKIEGPYSYSTNEAFQQMLKLVSPSHKVGSWDVLCLSVEQMQKLKSVFAAIREA